MTSVLCAFCGEYKQSVATPCHNPACQSQAMTDKPKVTAELAKSVTTIDGTTGDVTTTRAGKLRGFGKGFAEYLSKAPKTVMPDVVINTGTYPEGHKKASTWAVQIMIEPLDNEMDAITVADRVASVIKAELGRVK